MAVRKKKTARKKAPARRTVAAKPKGPDLEAMLGKLEERVAALESRVGASHDLADELRRAFRPTLDEIRDSLRAKRDVGTQTPYVLGGLIVVILIIAGVLANSGALSGDAFAVIMTICLAVAGHQAWKHFRPA